MSEVKQPKDLLHGITLKQILTELYEKHGWEYIGERIRVKCFTTNPTMNSSLKLLRRTPWAREKAERLYIKTILRKRPRKRVIRPEAEITE